MGKHLSGWVLMAIAIFGVAHAAEDWTQWGGPDRNFTVEARELSRTWGDSGPPQLWTRPLGGGFSSIVSDGKRLYTMFRDGDDEILIALEIDSGKTVWEYRYAAPIPKSQGLSTEYGKGPSGTPLLVDGKLVSLGFTGHVRCVETAKGKLLWGHDLGEEFEVPTPYFGHATSPLAVGKNVVVVAGNLFSFDLGSGKVIWRNDAFEATYGSPRLITVSGKQQIVTPVSGHLAAFDAKTGKTLWSQEHKNEWGTILTSPVVDDAGRVFISAAQVGSILIDPAATKAENRQVWKDTTAQVSHSNIVRSGKWAFASVGDSATFMTAISLEDGAQAWKERGFARANLIRVGDEYLLLDFDGVLALVELSGEGMEVVTRASINDEKTWTPPTLLGTRLFMRDETRIAAFDLSVRKKRRAK